MDIHSKLPNTKTTIFTIMSQLANETGAINLSQGFPNFPISKVLVDLVHKHMRAGRNQYAPMPGVMELREVLSEKINKLYGHRYDPQSEITVCSGATQAIYTAITALIHPGDEVILFEPAYDCYAPAVDLCKGICKYYTLKAPDYSVDWNEVENMITEKTKVIMINSPHNPTGSILRKDDLLSLERIAEEHDLMVLSDEVYEHIIFDKEKHWSVAAFEKLAKRSFLIASFGKTFHATGWKMGYITGPKEMMREFQKVHQFNVFSCNTPTQYALAEFLEDENNYLNIPEFYEDKRNLFLNGIKGSGFKVSPTSGSYFQVLDYSSISDEKDTDLAKRWTRDVGVASIPLSVFYEDGLDQKLLRFCFAKTDETIKQATEILRGIK